MSEPKALDWRVRFQLIWKILTGRFDRTMFYWNPAWGVTEITLRENRIDWSDNGPEYR